MRNLPWLHLHDFGDTAQSARGLLAKEFWSRLSQAKLGFLPRWNRRV